MDLETQHQNSVLHLLYSKLLRENSNVFCLLSLGLREHLVTPIAFGYPADWSSLAWPAKTSVFFPSRIKIFMTEGKEEKSTSFTVFLYKILSSSEVQLHWQRTEDSSVKAAPTRCRKAGRKPMSLVDGWREAGGRALGASWPERTCRFTSLLGVQWPEQCAYRCLTSPWNKAAWISSTVQRLCRHPRSPTLLAETNMDNLEVVSCFRLLLAQFDQFLPTSGHFSTACLPWKLPTCDKAYAHRACLQKPTPKL